MKSSLPGVIALTALLAACSGGGASSTTNNANNSPLGGIGESTAQSPDTVPNQTEPGQSEPAARYEVTIVNLTAAQPLSPPAVLLHGSGYRLFDDGKPATDALEVIAEGGDNSGLLASVSSHADVYAGNSAAGPIGPGSSARFMVSLPAGSPIAQTSLSVATMLVNTNDAIGAARDLELDSLGAGQARVWELSSFDAGTEANNERANQIPGPAGGGSGFNPARDDLIDAVLPHPGAVTFDDGLADSTLREVHRWVDPVARIQVRRLR